MPQANKPFDPAPNLDVAPTAADDPINTEADPFITSWLPWVWLGVGVMAEISLLTWGKGGANLAVMAGFLLVLMAASFWYGTRYTVEIVEEDDLLVIKNALGQEKHRIHMLDDYLRSGFTELDHRLLFYWRLPVRTGSVFVTYRHPQHGEEFTAHLKWLADPAHAAEAIAILNERAVDRRMASVERQKKKDAETVALRRRRNETILANQSPRLGRGKDASGHPVSKNFAKLAAVAGARQQHERTVRSVGQVTQVRPAAPKVFGD